MMNNLPHLVSLLKQLQQVPYLASKNLYRVAHYFLEMDEHKAQEFCRILSEARAQLAKCTLCWTWKERGQACLFCDSPKRDKRTICVIETWHDLYAIEKTGSYQGVYHVLGGSICPLDGVGPEDLTIEQLVIRVGNGCAEVILAVNQNPEGEATAAFIARKLENKGAKVTCLARGMPVGSSLELMDRLTLHKAITERRLF